jgi:RNA polymerase sigma-70 factor (ECF subfamily)
MNKEKDYLNMDDRELVVSTLGNKDYYQYLMKRYEDKLKRYIRRLAKLSEEDVEDILQEVFVKTYVNLNAFDTNLKFSSWIYRITHNETISYLRRLKTRPSTFNLELNEIIVNKLQSDLNIEKETDKKYLKMNMEKVLNNIDKKYQEVVVLKYMEDKDYQEISDILKKPVGTVAVLLSRAKKEIKEELLKNKIFLS